MKLGFSHDISPDPSQNEQNQRGKVKKATAPVLFFIASQSVGVLLYVLFVCVWTLYGGQRFYNNTWCTVKTLEREVY